MRFAPLLIVAVCALSVAACGGGGSGSTTVPVAVASGAAGGSGAGAGAAGGGAAGGAAGAAGGSGTATAVTVNLGPGQPGSVTFSIVSGGASASSPGAIVLVAPTRATIASNSAIVRVSASPAPSTAILPAWTIASTSVATLAGTVPSIGPTAPPGGTVVVAAGPPGATTLNAAIGNPYNITVSTAVYSYAAANFSCQIAARNVLGFAADGSAIASPASPDAYLSIPAANGFCAGATIVPAQSNAVVRHFPFGATAIASNDSADFVAVRASQWRADQFDDTSAPSGVTWLVRAASGATFKLGANGAIDVAPAGGDFTIAPLGVGGSVAVAGVPTPVPTFAATIGYTAGSSLFAPYGNAALSALVAGVPSPSYNSLVNSSWGGSASVTVTPPLFAVPAIAWTAGGPIAIGRTNGYDAAFTATAPGTGSLTATLGAPYNAAATIPVAAYRTIALGCGDASDGFGAAFNADGTATIVTSPAQADLYASFDPQSFTCNGATPANGGWFFPGGGVFMPNGDDPARQPPSGSPRGAPFSNVTANLWSAARTSESIAQYGYDTRPCWSVSGTVATPIPGCTTMSDAILLIRTQSGRYVKLFWIGRAPASFVGLYAVSAADGSFAP